MTRPAPAALAGLLLFVPPATAAEPPPLVDLVPDGAVGAVVVDVAALRTDPRAAELIALVAGPGGPLDSLARRLDLDPAGVDGVALFLTPNPPPAPGERKGLGIRRRSAFDEPVMLLRTAGPAPAVPDRGPAADRVKALPDGRTLAVTDRPGSPAFLNLGGTDPAPPAAGSALAAALKHAAAGPAPQLVMVGDVAAVRVEALPDVDRAVRDEDAWVPVFGLVRPAFVDADRLTLTATLAGGGLSARLVADAPDPAAADRLARTAEAAVTIGRNLLNGLPPALMRRRPEAAAAMGLAAGLLRPTLAGAEVTIEPADGDGGADADADARRVTVTMSADPAATAAAAELLTGLLRAEVGRRGRFGAARGIRVEEVDDAVEELQEVLEQMEEVEEAREAPAVAPPRR